MGELTTDKISIVSANVEDRSLRIVICDDEEEHLKELLSIVKPLQEKEKLSIETFFSANGLIKEMKQRKEEGKELPEVLLIDIVMPEMDGITLAKALRKIAPNSYLIFVTAHAEYAIEGYEARAFRYVLKPVTTEQIEKVLKNIRKEMKRNKKMVVSAPEGEYIINVEDIMYLSAEDKYTHLYTEKKHFMDRTSLSEYEILLKPFGFSRIHRKYIVNTRYHKCISKRNVILKNGIELPISFRKEKDYRKMLFQEIDEAVL